MKKICFSSFFVTFLLSSTFVCLVFYGKSVVQEKFPSSVITFEGFQFSASPIPSSTIRTNSIFEIYGYREDGASGENITVFFATN